MHDHFHDISEVFFALCKSVATPFSLGAWLTYQSDPQSVASLQIDARNYSCANAFRNDYLVANFLKKFKFKGNDVACKAAAMQRFANAESRCTDTNLRIRNFRSTGIAPADVQARLFAAQRKIATVLGPFDIVKVNEHCKWGPGATAGLTRTKAYQDIKHSTLPIQTTLGAAATIRAHIESDPHWFEALTGILPEGIFCLLENCFEYTEANRVVFVPKSATTHRTIAAEPTANSFLQQGVGRYIRRRLKKWGVDLDNQTPNQVWASLAHTLGLCTLDLSSASDTLCIELLALLFPLDWFLYLSGLRSAKGILPDGSVIHYSKFSSMGNAFTFEVESLIFWALCSAVRDDLDPNGVVSVYGDDIICPQSCAADTIALLNYAGFIINGDKSFVDGVFFESCGEHYFDGENVTPCFQKENLSTLPEYIRLGNRLRRWAIKSGTQHNRVARSAWLASRRLSTSAFPKSDTFWIPLGTEGDDGWLLSRDEVHHAPIRSNPNKGMMCNVLRVVPRKRDSQQASGLALWLRTAGTSVQQTDKRLPLTETIEFSLTTIREQRLRYVRRRSWIIPCWQFEAGW